MTSHTDRRGHNAVKGKQGFQKVAKDEPADVSLTSEYRLPRALPAHKAAALFYTTTVATNEIGRAIKANWLPNVTYSVTGTGGGWLDGRRVPGRINVRVACPADDTIAERIDAIVERLAPEYRRNIIFA